MDSTTLKEDIDADLPLENEDLLQKVFSRLPAKDFASAACVSKSWSTVCDQILSQPKLTTALSLNADLDIAVKEVLDKVLSEPVRPHFAIVFVGLIYSLEETHRLITQKLPSQIPVITNTANGMIGMEARTNLIREAKWQLLEEDHVPNDFRGLCDLICQINNCGIVLVVGRVPGLKVETIPLLQILKEDDRFLVNPRVEMIEKFCMDIKEYTASVSNCTSPDAIIMFGDERIDIKSVLLHMDSNMAKETVIVGDAGGGRVLYASRGNSRNYPRDLYSTDAVALVFAKDNSSNVGGKIRFSVTLSNGLAPFGPRLKVTGAVVVSAENATWLTARLAGHPGIFDTRELCKQIRAKIHDEDLVIYIGVTQQNECSNGSQRPYLAYYQVIKEADFRIVVDGIGIKPGDSFMFYHADGEMAFSSMFNAFDELKLLKTPAGSTSRSGIISSVRNKNEVFGGLIFSCCSRWDSLSLRGLHLPESFPFSTNYPSTPVAGLFCTGEIARVSINLISEGEGHRRGVGREGDDDGSNSVGCFLHYHSTVYLVMSHNPYR